MKIAVIGAGISGLGAAWALARRHQVTLYEKNARIGGHANTVDVPGLTPGTTQPVDTGFIVFNEATYPNLIALFDRLGVATEPSDMSFGLSVDGGRLEYSSDGVLGLFAQKRNFVNPRHYWMLRETLRFFGETQRLLDRDRLDGTLGEFLTQGGYGRGFVDDHLLPMAAAIWSASLDDVTGFPAKSFARFFANHGLLQTFGRPRWFTVTGGSRRYVEAMLAQMGPVTVCADRAVARVARLDEGGVAVTDRTGETERFDAAVLAGHADDSLAMLADPHTDEADALACFRYADNRAILHADAALMPRRKRAWASWNYLAGTTQERGRAVAVTYWMNRLQNIDPNTPLFVTLNPLVEPKPERVFAEFLYAHPQFDQRALAAQTRLPTIQGRDRIWFCGSYFGHGFHEDGLASGLAVAAALGALPPWQVRQVSPAYDTATPDDGAVGERPRMAAA